MKEERNPVAGGGIVGQESAALEERARPAFREEFRAVAADLARFLPNLLKLFGRLLRDGRVPVKEKVFVGLVVAYCVSPVDLIIDAIPVFGQLDDIFLILLALKRLMDSAGREVVHEHWDGPERWLDALWGIADAMASFLPGAGKKGGGQFPPGAPDHEKKPEL